MCLLRRILSSSDAYFIKAHLMAIATSTHDCSVLSVFRLSLGRRGPRLADKFKMADFQRPFVWTQENVQKILDDVDELRANPSPCSKQERANLYDINQSTEYFLGSICLRIVNDKRVYEVLDGQQRLTSILILAFVLNEQVQQCKQGCIQARWAKAIKALDAPSYWQSLLIISNPQSKKRISEVYWSFRRDYECLKLDVAEDPNAPRTDGMNLFEQTLYRDVQRFEYILSKGRFAVLILNSLSEAEQFFQGENNRGLPMTMLDLLKAYHMRQAPGQFKKIGKIWQSLGLAVSNPDNKEKYQSVPPLDQSNRWQKTNPDWPSCLMTELVLPAMLLQYGIPPWSAINIDNLALLKGVVGTHTGDSFIDEKIIQHRHDRQKNPLFDLRTPVRAGLPFFQEIAQYLKIAQAIDVILWEPETAADIEIWPHAGEALISKGLTLGNDRYTILKLALIAWADRFLKAGIMRSDNTWVDVAEALTKDGDFRTYGRNFAHFLDRLVSKGNTNNERIGAYETLFSVTLAYILRLSEPENSLLFLPHRSSSRAECLRKLKSATHPNTVRLTTTSTNYRQGYWNAYIQEFATHPVKEDGRE
mgnify:CR=1 FL=1